MEKPLNTAPVYPIRYASETEKASWDALIGATPNGGNLLQTTSFALAKASSGWTANYLFFRGDASVFADVPNAEVPFLALSRSVPLLGTIWYIPNGPCFATAEQLLNFADTARAWFTSKKAFLVKLDSELTADTVDLGTLREHGLTKSTDLQTGSVNTVVLDLTPGSEAVFKAFPQPGRYSVNRARRDGVETSAVPLTPENKRIMFDLLEETARASNFPTRTYEYYSTFWDAFARNDKARLFFATFEGNVIAAAFVVKNGPKAFYKDGASVRDRPAYGASHLLQWEAIQWALEDPTVESYDMMGTPPSDQLSDTDHPYHGIGRFKTSFNKTVVDRLGSFEMVLKPSAVSLWNRYGYRVMNKLNRMFKHEVFF